MARRGQNETKRVIGDLEKRPKERVRITLLTYNKVKLLDLRTFRLNPEGEWHPHKGLTVHQEMLPELIAIIEKGRDIYAAEGAGDQTKSTGN